MMKLETLPSILGCIWICSWYSPANRHKAPITCLVYRDIACAFNYFRRESAVLHWSRFTAYKGNCDVFLPYLNHSTCLLFTIILNLISQVKLCFSKVTRLLTSINHIKMSISRISENVFLKPQENQLITISAPVF